MAINVQGVSRFRDQMQDLRQAILEMGGLAEEALGLAVEALQSADEALAERGRLLDREIDRLEVLIGERSLRILALHQPAASDLRFVTMAMRLATDLERVGDLASNVCRRVQTLSQRDSITSMPELRSMSLQVRSMVVSALDAFVERDVDLAWEVLRRDDAVDATYQRILDDLERVMRTRAEFVAAGLQLVFVVKDLERAADHATSIAEGVIFLVHGRDIRHAGSSGQEPEE